MHWIWSYEPKPGRPRFLERANGLQKSKAGQWLCTFLARGQNTIPQKRFASLGIPSEETLQLSWQAARTITHILRRASSQVCCVWNLLQAEKIDFFFCGQNMFFVFLGAAAANGDNKLVMVEEAVQSHGSQDALSAIWVWWLVSFHRTHSDDARQIWQYRQSHLCWASEQFEPVLVVAERDALSRNESAESDISAETNTTISNEFCTPGLLSWKVLLFFSPSRRFKLCKLISAGRTGHLHNLKRRRLGRGWRGWVSLQLASTSNSRLSHWQRRCSSKVQAGKKFMLKLSRELNSVRMY